MKDLLDILFENSLLQMKFCDFEYKRYFFKEIDFDQRLIGMVGARGTGKTTALLQYLKELDILDEKKLYISADMIEISDVGLFDIAKSFESYGGEILVIDEIHKYRDFEKDLKNIYDRTRLRVIFSGSSAISLEHNKADLSRRAFVYKVYGLSYREFLEMKLSIKLPTFSLDELLHSHTKITTTLIKNFKPLQYFDEYLRYGYYPFYFEDKKRYQAKLESTINTVIEVDLPSIFSMKYENIINLKKMVKLICYSQPYKINISELSKKIGIHRDRLYLFIEYLTLGSIFLPLKAKEKGDNIFVKPAKLYLQNPNLYNSYCKDAKIGTIRECFFVNMVTSKHLIHYSNIGDFVIDDKYTVEVGGKNKSYTQIKDIENSFIVADDIEIGFKNKIPLWLFGFLY